MLFQLFWNIIHAQCFWNHSFFWLLAKGFLLFIPFIEVIHLDFWYNCLWLYYLLLYSMLLIVLIWILCLVARFLIFWNFLLVVWFVRNEIYTLITLLLTGAIFFLFRYSSCCRCLTNCRHFTIRSRLSIFKRIGNWFKAIILKEVWGVLLILFLLLNKKCMLHTSFRSRFPILLHFFYFGFFITIAICFWWGWAFFGSIVIECFRLVI